MHLTALCNAMHLRTMNGLFSTQTVKIMKIAAVLLLAACLHVSARGKAQTISLNVKDQPLTAVFQEIKKQSGYSFFYRVSLESKFKNVTVQISNVSFEQALEKVMQGQELSYEVVNKTVVIKEKEEKQTDYIPLPSLDVKGKVVDENGKPVVATVQVKGTNRMTSTNENGEFELKGLDENAILVITAINIEAKEIKVAGRSDLENITVKIKVSESEAVIVNTGYQKLKPNQVTGSIQVLNADQINRVSSTDILSRLVNVPGLLILGRLPDDGSVPRSSVIIRGYSTIFSNKEPLIVVDNFPYEGNIRDINPNDIESISILKDAAAASLWGTDRAGNGVIVITTKSGKYNQTAQVNFNSNITVGEKPDLFYNPVLPATDYVDLQTTLFNQGFYNTTINSPFRDPLTPVVEILLKRNNGLITAADSAREIDAFRNVDVRQDIDKYLMNKIVRQQYLIGINGGSRNHQYYVSAGFDKNMLSSNEERRLTATANNTFLALNGKLEISMNLWGAQTTNKNLGYSHYSTLLSYPYAQLADNNGKALPIARLRQGYIDTAGGGKLLDWTFYPLKDMNSFNDNSEGLTYKFTPAIKLKLTKKLDLNVLGLYEKGQNENRILNSVESYYTRDYINRFSSINWSTGNVIRPVPIGGILNLNNSKYTNKGLRSQLNYNLVRRHHQLTVLLGGEIGEKNISVKRFTYYGFNEKTGTVIPVDFANQYTTYITGTKAHISSGQGMDEFHTRSVSAYANAGYVYKGKYSLSTSLRKDGTNLFGVRSNNKWKPLWSIGGAWEISSEDFYRVKWMPKLRLRTTFGYQGNTNNTVPALLTIFYAANLNPWRNAFASIRNLPNADLGWEKVRQINFGVDFSAFTDRIAGTIEFFQKNGLNLIGNMELAPSSGNSLIKANSANISGHGIDVSITTKNILKKNFNWSSTIIFSIAKDKVTEYRLPTYSVNSYVSKVDGNPLVGNPVSTIYSYKWAGLDPVTGDPRGYLDGSISKNYSAILNSSNLSSIVYSGPATPTTYGSLLNSLIIGEFSLSFNISYKLGYFFRRESINYSALLGGSSPGHTDYLHRWQKPGDELNTKIPSIQYSFDVNREQFYSNSEILIEKGDHVRLQDLRISYNLPSPLVSKLSLKRFQIYAYATNLGILWRANKYGIDPDFNKRTNYTTGLPGKHMTAGISCNF